MKQVRFLLLSLILFPLSIPAASAQTNSLLWEISGNGLAQPSYLYGTIHIQDARVFQYGEPVKKALESSSAVVGELTFDTASMMQAMLKAMLPSSTSLIDILGEKDYKYVKSQLEKRLDPMTAMIAERMKPFFISAIVSMKSFESDSAMALDMYLQTYAKQNGKKVLGLETMLEQMAFIDSISLEEQGKMLVQGLKMMGKNDKAMTQMINLYLDQNLDQLLVETKKMGNEGNFEDKLLRKRNINMANRLVPIAEKQTAFFAVGAAHLPGEEGVINLLRKKGYTLKPIPFTFKKQ